MPNIYSGHYFGLKSGQIQTFQTLLAFHFNDSHWPSALLFHYGLHYHKMLLCLRGSTVKIIWKAYCSLCLY